MNSHSLPLFISYRSSGEKLIKYQENSSCVIMSVILMTTLFYKALILQGEIWCWLLLGLKGLNIPGSLIISFLIGVVTRRCSQVLFRMACIQFSSLTIARAASLKPKRCFKKGLCSFIQNLKSWCISVEHKTEEAKLVYRGQILLANNTFSRYDTVYRCNYYARIEPKHQYIWKEAISCSGVILNTEVFLPENKYNMISRH